MRLSALREEGVVRFVSTHKLASHAAAGGERTLLEIPRIGLFVRPLSINVDAQMLNALLNFVDDVLTTVDIQLLDHSVRELQISDSDPGSPEWKRLLGPPISMLDVRASMDKVFISSLVVGRLAFVVNIRSGRQGAASTGEGASLDGTPGLEDQPKTEVIRAVLSALNVRASISDAHLVLARREQKDICGPLNRLLEEIVLSYVGSAVGQLHKVLGAVDLFGNPAMVVKHISSGMENGIMEVRKGFQTGRADRAMVGCGRGMVFAFSGLAAAFFDFATRCFGSWYGITDMVARNTDKYSISTDLIQQHGLQDQPSNCIEGVWVGSRSCALNFGLSFANIFYKPIRGTRLGLEKAATTRSRRKKCIQCCRGCAFGGLSGLASTCGLPSSLLLCGQLSTAGILNQISAIPMLSLIRPRRVFSDGVTKLASYSLGYAQSHDIVKSVPSATQYNFTAVITLHREKTRSTRQQRVLQCLKLRRADPLREQDLLFIGAEHIGRYRGRDQVWVVRITDVISLDVVHVTPPRLTGLVRRLSSQRASQVLSVGRQRVVRIGRRRSRRRRRPRHGRRSPRRTGPTYFIRLLMFDPIRGLASALERRIAAGDILESPDESAGLPYRLIPCANWTVARRVFAFLCGRLQGQLYASRAPWRRAVTTVAIRRAVESPRVLRRRETVDD